VSLGTGTDVVSGEMVRFVVPPNMTFGVLTELHAGRHPTIDVHDFDVVDWSTWWQEEAHDSRE
jgi:hypothetical protein